MSLPIGDIVLMEESSERQSDTAQTLPRIASPEEEQSTVDRTTKMRFYAMFFLIGGFFLVELIVGVLSKSITLLADAMHMLSDVIALTIGFYAVNLAQRQPTSVSTYGYKRAEVVGALINGVFLLTVCFNIVLESVHRFIEVDEAAEELTENIDQVIIVGAIGLGINVVGLIIFMFTGHGHSHGGKACGGHGHSHEAGANKDGHVTGTVCCGHGHSHGHGDGHGHSHASGEACHGHGTAMVTHTHSKDEESKCDAHGHGHGHTHEHGHGHAHAHAHEHVHGHSFGHGHEHGHEHSHGSVEEPNNNIGVDVGHSHGHSHEHGMNVNLRGVFLHMMGDALGSIGVMISAFVIKYVPEEEDPKNLRFLADPLCSLFIVVLLLNTTLPFVKETCSTLMQMVPPDLDIAALRADILSDGELRRLGLVDLHDMHVWSLNDEHAVGTVHGVVSLVRSGAAQYTTGPEDSNAIVLRLREMLRERGIDGATTQLEFVSGPYAASTECSLPTTLKHPASFSQRAGPQASGRRKMSKWASMRGARFAEWASTPVGMTTRDSTSNLRSFKTSFGHSFKRSFVVKRESSGGSGGAGGRRFTMF